MKAPGSSLTSQFPFYLGGNKGRSDLCLPLWQTRITFLGTSLVYQALYGNYFPVKYIYKAPISSEWEGSGEI